MSEKVTSRLAGFYKLPIPERLNQIGRMFHLSPEEVSHLQGATSLAPETANQMIENAVGTFSLPLGLGLNLQVNGRDYIVPMAVEEPSVIAAGSFPPAPPPPPPHPTPHPPTPHPPSPLF